MSDRWLSSIERRVEKLSEQAEERIGDGRDLSVYIGRPVAFAREVCHFDPYPKQVAIIESAFANPWTVVRGPHAAGKDACLGPIALYGAYVLNMLVITVSATEKQLLGQTFREIRTRHEIARLPGRILSSAIEIDGEHRIRCMTSGNTSNLTGWHDANGVLVLISEAQGEQVESVAFDAAIANATDEKSRIVVVGNPVKASGRFYEVHQRTGWTPIHVSAFDHPNIIEGRTVIPGGPTSAWIEAVRNEYGESSPFYTARVLGEFPSQGSVDGLVRREWLEPAFDRHDTNALANDAASRSIVLSLDVARYGDDASVLAIVQGPVVRELVTWRNAALTESVATVIRHAERFRIDRSSPTIIVDDVGVGSGATDILRAKGYKVIAFNGGSRPSDARYLNARAEAAWRFREGLEHGRIALPRNSALEEEALATEWQTTGSGKIQLVSKDTVRSAIGHSPDTLDAVLMALWHTLAPVKVPIVAPHTTPLFSPYGNNGVWIDYDGAA